MLQQEIDEDPNAAAVLRPLKDRAERILRDLEGRRTTGLAAMDLHFKSTLALWESKLTLFHSNIGSLLRVKSPFTFENCCAEIFWK